MLTLLLLLTLWPDAQTAAAPTVADLAWMAGCWRQTHATRTIEEVWLAPAGDTLLGVNRTVSNGRTVEHEFLQIRRQDGTIVYIAQPASQAPTTFTATSVGAREAIFENPTHDFPQRIIYRPTATGLAARVEGMRNGALRGLDFAFTRDDCPGK
jgi:Domain of unknown function (DUF6265)